MEPRQLDEGEVLRAARRVGIRVPEILFQGQGFMICSYVHGTLLRDSTVDFTNWQELAVDVASVMKRLEGISPLELRSWSRANPWPKATTAKDVVLGLLAWVDRTRLSAGRTAARIYHEIGITDDMFRELEANAEGLAAREFQVCHGDIQPANIVVHDSDFAYLDWELAVWCDPLYDVALHLQRTMYSADVEEMFWRVRIADSTRVSSQDRLDLDIFIRVEALKSLINDTIRYLERYRSAPESDWIAPYFERKLRFAAKYFSVAALGTGDIDTLMRDAVCLER